MPTLRLILVGPMPRPHAGAARGGRRRGDERVGAVVHVEQRRLGAFQQHDLAVVQRVVQHQAGVGDVAGQPLAVAGVLLADR